GSGLLNELKGKGYWPVIAKDYLNQEKFSRTIELCNMRQNESPEILSGRIILAQALFHSGQMEAAENLFYEILRVDPENIASLKYLGDIKFGAGEEATAYSYYKKVIEIDPLSNCLHSPIMSNKSERTKSLTLARGGEGVSISMAGLKNLPFKTETIGDLLLAQGHTRLAHEVFSELAKAGSPRIIKKLEEVKEALKTGKGNNV
ncbi:MAG: hypothetical protein ABIJ45_11635, partial [Candidatus Zixiibacteriota bacterium]